MGLEDIKELPSNLEAEQMLLSQLLLDNKAIYKIIDCKLKHQDFFYDEHKKLYSTILKLIGDGQTADAITIKNKSGVEVSDEILFKAITVTGIADYANIIKDYAIKREVIKNTNRLSSIGYDKNSSIDEIKAKADEIVNICFQTETDKDFSDQLVDIHEGLYEEPKERIKTNYKLIDNKLHLSKGQLITIAGRPGVGKSAVMCCLALAMDNVAFFSLEMQNREIAYRMASNVSKVPYSIINGGIKDKPDHIQQDISVAFDKIKQKNIAVYDKKMSLLDIKMEMKKLKITKGIDVVFIDYLQLMKALDPDLPRAIQIGMMTRELKSLAKELDVLIITGSQLNREIEKRMDKTPKLSDLRESGDIEQDSDIVGFVDRDKETYPDKISLIIAKHRNGEEMQFDLMFNGPTMTMLDKLYGKGGEIF